MAAREGTAAHAPAHSRELLHALVENASDLILTSEVLGEDPGACTAARPDRARRCRTIALLFADLDDFKEAAQVLAAQLLAP